MLYAVDTGKKITKLPHESNYVKWRKCISTADYARVVARIRATIEGNEVNTAGWIPDSNWIGTPYEKIYYACGQNEIQAGLFFGLIVFKLFMDDEDTVWGFGRYEANGHKIRSMTYFKLNIDPKTLK